MSNTKLPIKKLLTLRDVSEMFNLSMSTIKSWCRKQKIDHIKIDRKYLFEEDRVIDFLEEYRKVRGSLKQKSY